MKTLTRMIALLFIISTISYAQFTSVKNGSYDSPQTWSTNPDATAIPDSNSTVTINHTISGSGNCKDLTVSENGKIYSGEYLSIYGNLYNNGEIRDDPNHGSDYLTVTIRGNIINNGLYSTGNTYFKGSGEHHLQSLSSHPISLGIARNNNPNSVFIVDDVVYLSGILMLEGSKLLLPGVSDTLVLFNNGLVDGGLIDCNNNVIIGKGSDATIGFNGSVAFNPKQTYVQNAILEGYINLNGAAADSSSYTTTFLGNVVNNGTIVTAPANTGNYATVFVEGEFTNNGLIKKQSNGFALKFTKNGNFTNNGELLCDQLIFCDSHTFVNNSDSISVLKISGANENSSVIISKDLLFNVDATINMNGGKMILSNSAKLDAFGMENTILEADGSEISTRSNSYIAYSILKDVKVKNVKIGYSTTFLGGIEIVENGQLTFLNSRGGNIEGKILNNGTVTGRIDSVITGDITNNGTWNSKVVLNANFVNNGEVAKNCNLKINGTVTNKSAWKGNTEVIGNVINEGIIDSIYSFKVEGNVTNSSTFRTSGSTEVKGDVDNSGILDCGNFNITGNIKNTGSWRSYQTTLSGSTDQHITMPSDSMIAATYAVLFDAMLNGVKYQWYRNGEILEGEKSRYLYLNNPGLLPDNATYNCKVDSSFSRNIVIQSLTDVEDEKNVEANELPIKFALSQNYPNPFNPTTTIKFSLPQNTIVTLKVYNAVGQEVATLINSELAAGYHSVTFNANNLPSGIYFYRLQAGKFVNVKKMVLVK